MGITREQALDCFRSDDLVGIGMEADAVRRGLHPEGVVSYVVECKVDAGEVETVLEAAGEAVEAGATGVELHERADSDRKIEWFEGLFRLLKQRFGSISVHSLSAPEVLGIAERSGLDLQSVIARLRDAGLDSIPGDGAGILDDSVRERVPGLRLRTEEWLRVHRTAHQLGVRTTATMTFGMGETMEQRVNHLEALRQLQDETGGFTAFIPLAFRPGTDAAGGPVVDEATAVEYLKTLAVSRMYLHNIENLQGSWATQGLKVLQMGLRFGANDVGPVMLGNEAVRATEEELRRIIRDAGFKPVQRDTPYRVMFLN